MPDIERYGMLVIGSGEAGKHLTWTLAQAGPPTIARSPFALQVFICSPPVSSRHRDSICKRHSVSHRRADTFAWEAKNRAVASI
jgi:hypothetical protein